MDLTSKFFEAKRKLLMLHLTDRLNLPPGSEIGTLFTIQDLNNRPDAENVTISEIAALLNVSVPTVSRCLQKLSGKGYISKTMNENDRRGTCVTLTPEGEALCNYCKDTINLFIARAVSHIAPDELEQFIQTYDKLFEAVSMELSADSRTFKQPPSA